MNKQLANSDIHIQIGEQDFKIPKDTFSSAGDSPNFFSLGFGVFLTNPDDAFPGLDRVGLIRPPPIEAPRVLGKSASTFTELLHLLRGYPLHIRDTQHRAELVQDCRYFHLKGLEQKLVLHDISYNPQRQSHEIVMRIEDLRQTGISVHEDTSIFMAPSMCVRYARPYADNTPYDLIVEIGEGSTTLDLFSMRAEFFNNVKLRITSLFQVIANRISATKNLRDPLQYSTDSVQISTNDDTYVTVDGKDYPTDFLPRPRSIEKVFSQPAPKKRKTVTSDEPEKREWMIMKGQWRIQVLAVSGSGDRPSMNVMLHAVRLEVLSGQVERNKARGFLA